MVADETLWGGGGRFPIFFTQYNFLAVISNFSCKNYSKIVRVQQVWEYKPRSSLCTHTFHHTDSTDPDIHVQDGWMPATKTHPACTIHENQMWLPQWLDWKTVTYTKIKQTYIQTMREQKRMNNTHAFCTLKIRRAVFCISLHDWGSQSSIEHCSYVTSLFSNTHMHMCMRMPNTHTYTHIYTCTHTHTHIDSHTHMHVHTHTDTQSRPKTRRATPPTLHICHILPDLLLSSPGLTTHHTSSGYIAPLSLFNQGPVHWKCYQMVQSVGH